MSTYYDISTMTAQQVLEASVNHVFNQGKPSYYDDGCKYKGEGGLSCAAAVFIPPDKYQKSFEGKTWIHVSSKLGTEQHKDLIGKLQQCHDMYAEQYLDGGTEFLRLFLSEAKRIAEQYELDGSFIDQLREKL